MRRPAIRTASDFTSKAVQACLRNSATEIRDVFESPTLQRTGGEITALSLLAISRVLRSRGNSSGRFDGVFLPNLALNGVVQFGQALAVALIRAGPGSPLRDGVSFLPCFASRFKISFAHL